MGPGSPAHTGIDLARVGKPAAVNRLPRTHGDRPSIPGGSNPSRLAPPHTRGSTFIAAQYDIIFGGSPAHTGIDPARPRRTRSSSWLPRTHGDRPCYQKRGGAGCGAPPHTRGSTSGLRAAAAPAAGSPAHTGIDLRSAKTP